MLKKDLYSGLLNRIVKLETEVFLLKHKVKLLRDDNDDEWCDLRPGHYFHIKSDGGLRIK